MMHGEKSKDGQTTQPFWQSLRLSVEVKMRLTQDTGSKIRNRHEKLRQQPWAPTELSWLSVWYS